MHSAAAVFKIFLIAAGLHLIAGGVCHINSENAVYDSARLKKAGFLFRGRKGLCSNSLLGPLSVWF